MPARGASKGVMPAIRLRSRGQFWVLIAAGAAALLCLAQPASSQRPPVPVPPRTSPLAGRPDTEAAMRLAPLIAPSQPTALDRLPINQLRVPRGFRIEVYASGVTNARSLRVGDKGTVFAGTNLLDRVYAVVSRDGRPQLKIVASGLYRPNGLAFKDGTLYIAELSRISKIEHVEDVLDNPPKPTVIYDQLPKDEAHGWKFLAVGPDSKLYVEVGQPGNDVLHDKDHGQIRRLNFDGTGAEVVAYGVRHSVGFDWHPETKQFYFTDNGRDWMSEDVPQDELNRVTKVGEHFGAPYCWQGNIPDSEFGWGKSCSDYTAPVGLMGPHAGVLGMRFYTGSMFPKSFKNAIIVARHGSWNRSKKFGGDVVVVQLDKEGKVKSIEPLITGFLVDNSYIGRPVDVLQMKDGSMLVSDDYNGAVYRVTYGKQKVARQ
jgi:glucose/arabinose dehydrogenase